MECEFCGHEAQMKEETIGCDGCLAEYDSRDESGRCVRCGEGPKARDSDMCAGCTGIHAGGGNVPWRNFPGS